MTKEKVLNEKEVFAKVFGHEKLEDEVDTDWEAFKYICNWKDLEKAEIVERLKEEISSELENLKLDEGTNPKYTKERTENIKLGFDFVLEEINEIMGDLK